MISCPFRSIIAQDGKVVHAGDFVKLSLPFHDVRFIYLFIFIYDFCSKVIVISFLFLNSDDLWSSA